MISAVTVTITMLWRSSKPWILRGMPSFSWCGTVKKCMMKLQFQTARIGTAKEYRKNSKVTLLKFGIPKFGLPKDWVNRRLRILWHHQRQVPSGKLSPANSKAESRKSCRLGKTPNFRTKTESEHTVEVGRYQNKAKRRWE